MSFDKQCLKKVTGTASIPRVKHARPSVSVRNFSPIIPPTLSFLSRIFVKKYVKLIDVSSAKFFLLLSRHLAEKTLSVSYKLFHLYFDVLSHAYTKSTHIKQNNLFKFFVFAFLTHHCHTSRLASTHSLINQYMSPAYIRVLHSISSVKPIYQITKGIPLKKIKKKKNFDATQHTYVCIYVR